MSKSCEIFTAETLVNHIYIMAQQGEVLPHPALEKSIEYIDHFIRDDKCGGMVCMKDFEFAELYDTIIDEYIMDIMQATDPNAIFKKMLTNAIKNDMTDMKDILTGAYVLFQWLH